MINQFEAGVLEDYRSFDNFPLPEAGPEYDPDLPPSLDEDEWAFLRLSVDEASAAASR